jgi:hypothetical protein
MTSLLIKCGFRRSVVESSATFLHPNNVERLSLCSVWLLCLGRLSGRLPVLGSRKSQPGDGWYASCLLSSYLEFSSLTVLFTQFWSTTIIDAAIQVAGIFFLHESVFSTPRKHPPTVTLTDLAISLCAYFTRAPSRKSAQEYGYRAKRPDSNRV